MPTCDAYIPDGALLPEAEREFLSKVTDLLLLHEEVDPANQAARALAGRAGGRAARGCPGLTNP
jgi:hypothetical protein